MIISAKVKKAWSYLCCPIYLHGMHKDFTLTLDLESRVDNRSEGAI
jgi:hypothetical protein